MDRAAVLVREHLPHHAKQRAAEVSRDLDFAPEERALFGLEKFEGLKAWLALVDLEAHGVGHGEGGEAIGRGWGYVARK